MALLLFLGAAFWLAQFSFLFAAVASPVLAFLIWRTAKARWGVSGATPILFFAGGAFLFSLFSVKTQETWFVLAAALCVVMLFAEGAHTFSQEHESSAAPLLRRAPVLILLGLYLYFAAGSTIASFGNFWGVPFSVAVTLAAAFIAYWLLGTVFDVRRGKSRERVRRTAEALVFGLVSGEMMLAASFIPFAPLARATLLATMFWVAWELSEALEASPAGLRRITGSFAMGAIVTSVLFLTAPWP